MSPYLPVAVDLDMEMMNDTPAQDDQKEICRLAAQPTDSLFGSCVQDRPSIRSVDSELSVSLTSTAS